MFERSVLGLDVGSWSVKAVLLSAGLRSAEVVRVESLVLPPGASPEEREGAIELFLEQHELHAETVVTALPADRVTQRHLRFPFSGARRIEQAIGLAIEDELPVPLGQLVLAHERVSASPEQTDVLALLAPRGEVDEQLQALRRIDAEPRIIEIEGAVLANLSRHFEFDESPRLLLDIGHRKSTLCLLAVGRPALLRSVAVAGRDFTAALAADRDIRGDAAEHAKHAEGLFEPMTTKPVSPGVGALLDHLTRETMRSLQASLGDPRDPLAPREIVLCGGSAQCRGLPEYLEERTGLSCRRLALPASAPVNHPLADADVPSFAHATALALRAASSERVTQVDLRQGEFEYVADLSAQRPQLQLTLGLFGLLLALWVGSLGLQLLSARRHAGALQQRIAEVFAQAYPNETPPDAPAQALTQRLRDARELANHLGVTGSGISVLEVLRLISERIPANLDISLSDLRLERHSVRARGRSPDYESVDHVRAELERVEAFEEVVLSDVVKEPRGSGNTFALTIKFTGNSE